jgi:hypothetical protein
MRFGDPKGTLSKIAQGFRGAKDEPVSLYPWKYDCLIRCIPQREEINLPMDWDI